MIDRDPSFANSQRGSPATRTTGERLLVLLAVTVLLGGILIAVGNAFGPDTDEIAQHSPAPSEGDPQPSTPASNVGLPHQLVLVPGDPPPITLPESCCPEFYVRALRSLPIHGTDPDGPIVGSVEAGEVVAALEDDVLAGWLRLIDHLPSGWIAVTDGAAALAEVYPATRPPSGYASLALGAGDRGFVAVGTLDDGRGDLYTSTDGDSWTRSVTELASRFSGGRVPQWGPAGWLTIDEWDTPIWVWRSADGTSWESLGSLAGRGATGVGELIGSPIGYLLNLSDSSVISSWWFSANGLTWTEMPVTGLAPTALPHRAKENVVSGRDGFYAWYSRPPDWVNADPGPAGAYSPDGRAWQTVQDGPSGAAARVVFLDDRMIGLDEERLTGAIRVWSGSLADGELQWGAPQELPGVFGDDALALLAGGGDRAVAITWDRETEEIRSWSSDDGTIWASIRPPDGGFSVIPHATAGSPAGILVGDVGGVDIFERRNVASPVLWRLADGRWDALRSSALSGPQTPQEPCPAPPVDALAFTVLDPDAAVRCFGDAELSFLAFSVRCNACYRRVPQVPWEPAWLAPQSPRLFLAPFRTASPRTALTALDPTLTASPAWEDAWVTVTGHFDDGAAAGCRQQLDEVTEPGYGGRWLAIEECRRRFVITHVVLADGP